MSYYFLDQKTKQRAFHNISLKSKFLLKIFISLSPEQTSRAIQNLKHQFDVLK